jgi:hypothetical protein
MPEWLAQSCPSLRGMPRLASGQPCCPVPPRRLAGVPNRPALWARSPGTSPKHRRVLTLWVLVWMAVLPRPVLVRRALTTQARCYLAPRRLPGTWSGPPALPVCRTQRQVQWSCPEPLEQFAARTPLVLKTRLSAWQCSGPPWLQEMLALVRHQVGPVCCYRAQE